MMVQVRRCKHCQAELPDRYKGREALYCRPPKNCKEEARKQRKLQDAKMKTESLIGTLVEITSHGSIQSITS